MNTVDIVFHPMHPETKTADAEAPALPDRELAAAAYARVLPELDTVTDPLRISADIPRLVGIVFRVMPRLRVLVPRIAEELPKFPLERIDKLTVYALAALHAYVLAQPATSAESPLQPLLAEGLPLRESLFVAADALAHFGLLDEARIDALRPGTGHLDAALDLLGLSELLQERWHDVEGRTCITRGDVERAQEIGTKLVTLLGGTVAPSIAAERRAKAYTLVVRTYDQCRRAVGYLRWDDGDLDEVLPSLFIRPRSRSPKPQPAETPAAAEPGPANAVLGNGGSSEASSPEATLSPE